MNLNLIWVIFVSTGLCSNLASLCRFLSPFFPSLFGHFLSLGAEFTYFVIFLFEYIKKYDLI